nr:DUF3102 domain-containing protein [Dehalobacter sp. 12DCB1]
MTYPAKDTATDPENDPVSNTVPDVISGRTPHVIAAEINMIKYQAENVYLAATVEIGRRLTEAKSLLKFGEWGKWLEESVDFSQSRANKLMRIFKEYGEGQLTNSNSEPNPNSRRYTTEKYTHVSQKNLGLIKYGAPRCDIKRSSLNNTKIIF